MEKSNQLTRNNFIYLCIASYLLAIAYGVTFLLSLLVSERGGNDATTGLIISIATIGTILLIIITGHISDRIGIIKSIVVFGFLLSLSNIGFALSSQANYMMIIFGFMLGMGWGVFYTLGPILVASVAGNKERTRCFTLLSGSIMSGIGTGPLLGRLMSWLNYEISTAFLLSALTSFFGACIFWTLNKRFKTHTVKVTSSRLSIKSICEISKSKALFSIIMVGLGGCIFGGLSSFQTTYAATRGFDYVFFFLGFLLTAISSRLFLASYVTYFNPFLAAFVLTLVMVISMVLFLIIEHSVVLYITASILLGFGYGLTYSVINALAANEAPEQWVAQSLLLFSLSYFIGIFGFPLIAGQLIVEFGIDSLLISLLVIAVVNNLTAVYRIINTHYF